MIRRQKYIRSLTERGWQFVNSPTLAITAGLSVPPLGLGFDRSTDEQVIGTTRQMTRTQTSADSNGNTTTRTVTEQHSEDLLEIYLPFNLPYLRIRSEGLLPNWMKSGQHVEFESAQFNSIIGYNLDVLAGFLARVPSFVWQDLAITPPSFS